MAISIKGVNTGVIRKSNNFIALALKIKEPRNKESLFFMSVMELRDLLIALESRMHQKHKLDAAARLQYEQARDKVIKKMAENIPEILVDELKNADINRRVNTLELTDNQGENLTFVLTLHDGSKCELVVNELQIEMLARAIIHAINNAEMRELALRITSLLDFLPLYDVDCQENGNLEYDTYSQSEWKHNLFDHYLAVLYRFKDESGKEQFSGAVVKTREATPGKEIEAITRRMLDFSQRLKKLAGVPCQVYVRTVAANNAQPLTQDQCLRALHHLRVQSTSKTAPQAK
ncbi:YjeJ family protein [Escherichia coli]|uniref:YjeJ family protein n=1 Tax=Escherichia coli TaxID=562 RepID=UPI000B7E659A|nr:YjeJ family protein [Escherichia coli]